MQNIKAKDLFGSLWPNAPQDLYVSSVVTDNRKAKQGSVFVAIKGERADGHDFAVSAFEKGAQVLLCERPVALIDPARTVVVPDILDAMIALGANYRAMFSPQIIGVTGSVGKTTTKDFCTAIFNHFGSTISTKGNENNEIGVPNTLFGIDEETKYAVVEMGMRNLGEISKLSLAARPHAAIITGIGLAHIEQLGTLENTLKAKLEICDGIAQGAPLILNAQDKYLRTANVPSHIKKVYVGMQGDECDISICDVKREKNAQSFTLKGAFGSVNAYIPAPGNHLVLDAALSFAAAVSLGLPAAEAAQALSRYKISGMRQNIKTYKNIYVIEDCYNANPDSMRAALSIMRDMENTGKRIAVLGDMLELGKSSIQEHKKLAKACIEADINIIITVGTLAALAGAEAELLGLPAHICQSNAEAAAILKNIAAAGDAVLVKASRGMHFEEILQSFYDGKIFLS